MEKLEDYVEKRIREELKKKGEKGWSIKYFTEEILGKSETWLHNKFHERSKFTFRDLEEIASGLGMMQTDFLPTKLKYDIDHMSLTRLMKVIAREEIEEYLKNNNFIKPKK